MRKGELQGSAGFTVNLHPGEVSRDESSLSHISAAGQFWPEEGLEKTATHGSKCPDGPKSTASDSNTTDSNTTSLLTRDSLADNRVGMTAAGSRAEQAGAAGQQSSVRCHTGGHPSNTEILGKCSCYISYVFDGSGLRNI